MPITDTSRSLSDAERNLAASIFGAAIDYSRVRLNRRKWWPFQPRGVVMAPDGEIWFHPDGSHWCDDFAHADHPRQGLFIHEMMHVLQRQRGIYLPLARHPFCRYSYTLKPGWPLERYGIEQQAEIVRHTFLLRQGVAIPGAPSLEQYETVLRFKSA